MSRTEIWVHPLKRLPAALVFVAALAGFYLIFGYVPFILWLVDGVVAVALLWSLIRKPEPGPVIILDDEGLLDKRLKVGVIQWGDIRRIKSHSLSGATYISLQLHNMKDYESRRPPWLRLLAKAQLIMAMTPIAIATNHLSVDHKTLVGMIHEGCGGVARETRTAGIH